MRVQMITARLEAKPVYTYNSEIDTLKGIITGPVIVAIDPSKTNMGVVIGHPSGEIIAHFNISGVKQDTYDYCVDFKSFFKQILCNANVQAVCYETVILPRNTEKQSYVAMTVLNEIQANIKDLAVQLVTDRQNIFGINNWAWKNAILPEEYRKKSLKGKGSYKFLCEIDSRYYNVSNDITDAICIFMYYIKCYAPTTDLYPVRDESRTDTKACICTYDKLPNDVTWFKYNPNISLDGNIGFVQNRSIRYCCCEMPDDISIQDVYRLPHILGTDDKYCILVNYV